MGAFSGMKNISHGKGREPMHDLSSLPVHGWEAPEGRAEAKPQDAVTGSVTGRSTVTGSVTAADG